MFNKVPGWLGDKRPLSAQKDYIGDKVLGGDLVLPTKGYSNLLTSLPFCSAMTQNGKG